MDLVGIGDEDVRGRQSRFDLYFILHRVPERDNLLASHAIANDEDAGDLAGSLHSAEGYEDLGPLFGKLQFGGGKQAGPQRAVGVWHDGFDNHRPRVVGHHRRDELHGAGEQLVGKAVNVESHRLSGLNAADVLL